MDERVVALRPKLAPPEVCHDPEVGHHSRRLMVVYGSIRAAALLLLLLLLLFVLGLGRGLVLVMKVLSCCCNVSVLSWERKKRNPHTKTLVRTAAIRCVCVFFVFVLSGV